mmetsp:Transcript_17173/g.56905  ORF Transcript_17173/g.56905 Transcript_17173/m.56905 type:complete len:950 (-) Transcript_17173:3146-5995(-)
MGNPLDTSVVFSPHKYQISPRLFRSSADRQEVEVLFEDIAEVLVSTNSYFRVKLKDDFDIEWQMSGGGNYPLAFFKTLALVRWNVKQRSGAELIELTEDEGRDQLRALAKQPLESEEAFWRNVDKIKLLFKNLKDSIQGVVGAHQRMGPLEIQIAELLHARCKESTCESLQSLALNRELRNWKKSNMRPEKISLDEIFHWGRILKTRSKTTTTVTPAMDAKGDVSVVNITVASEPMVPNEPQAVGEVAVGKKRSSGSGENSGQADSGENSHVDPKWYGNYPVRGSIPPSYPQGIMFPSQDPFFNFYAQGQPSMYPFPIQGPVGNVPTFYQASGQAPSGPGRAGQDQAAFDPSSYRGGFPGRGGEGDGGPNHTGYRGRGRRNQDGYHNGGRGSFKGGYGRGQGGQKGHGGKGWKGGRGHGNFNHNHNYNNNNYNQNNGNYKNQRFNPRGVESEQPSSVLQNLLSGGVVDAETTRKMGEALIQAAQRMAANASSSSHTTAKRIPSSVQGLTSGDQREDTGEHRLGDDTEYVPDGAMSPVPPAGRRTRRDFKAERGVLESKYVNRDVEVLVNGQVEQGKILQMVFKEGKFLARIVFPTLDNYWVLRSVTDPDIKFLEQTEQKAMVVLTSGETISEVCMLADYYSCSFPPNVFGDMTDHTKVFKPCLDRAADEIMDVVEATVGGSPEVVVLSQHKKFPQYLQVTHIVQGSTESEEILYVWDRGEDRTSLQPASQRFVPVWRDEMYKTRLQHVDPVSSAPQVSANVDPTFRDTRLLVANLALVSPVWDAVELASDLLSLMSSDRDNPAAMPENQADYAMTAACDAGDVENESSFDKLPDPKTRSEMLRRPDRHLWEQAEKEEIAKIESRGVWEVVTRDQKNRESNHSVLARGLWVYTSKRDLKGKILKRKGRLVIMGNLLPSSEELFAPTTSLDNIRLLLSIAVDTSRYHESSS